MQLLNGRKIMTRIGGLIRLVFGILLAAGAAVLLRAFYPKEWEGLGNALDRLGDYY